MLLGAAARSRRVFDCAVGLGLARGTVSPAALAVVAAHLPGAALGGAVRGRAAARSGV